MPTQPSVERSECARTQYEKDQNFNFVVRYLHRIRYGYLLEVFQRLQGECEGRPIRVVDIGCAHAQSFALLDVRFDIAYTGIELDKTFAETAAERYSHLDNFRIINDSVERHYDELTGSDIVMALETLEHVPEQIVVRLIEKIAAARPKVFLCSVPNEVGPIVWVKNVGSLLMGYMRHREYSWRETFYAGIYALDSVETHGTGHKGFDWRWLAQTIRHNMRLSTTLSSPFRWLPKTLSVSVVFVCHPATGPTPAST